MSNDYLKPLHKLENLETKEVLKASVLAHRALGELKGLAMTMPNRLFSVQSGKQCAPTKLVK